MIFFADVRMKRSPWTKTGKIKVKPTKIQILASDWDQMSILCIWSFDFTGIRVGTDLSKNSCIHRKTEVK